VQNNKIADPWCRWPRGWHLGTRGTRDSLSSTRWRKNLAFVPYFDIYNLHGVEEKSWLTGYVFHNKQHHQ